MPMNNQKNVNFAASRYGRSYRTVNTLHGPLQKPIREF